MTKTNQHGGTRAVVSVERLVSPAMRTARNGHPPAILWMTGMPASGKSTLAFRMEHELFRRGYQVCILDGDVLRQGICADLSYSRQDRAENIRRVGALAPLFANAGFVVVVACISPYRADRKQARRAAGATGFHEVHLNADVSVCEQRDQKGHYARARAGEIAEFTGVSAPYEEPEGCELVIDTGSLDIEQSVARLLAYVEQHVPLSGT